MREEVKNKKINKKIAVELFSGKFDLAIMWI
jgi:hypothetical protein